MAPRQTVVERSKIPALGVIAPPPIHVQTPNFDGSLAMLFACVRDRKIDLLDVPLFPICEAYFGYLLNVQQQDLDEAAAALAALSYLLERKAWLLLPAIEDEPQIDEPLELPDPTAHEYKGVMDVLLEWQEARSRIFFRSPDVGPEPYELPIKLANVSVADLARAFERMMARAHREEVKPLGKARRSLDEQMRIVIKAVSNDWQRLQVLVEEPFSRTDLVYWFLALLELMRLGQVIARVEDEEVEFARTQRQLRFGEAA
jgi:segregation and condensation protein A